MERLETHRRPHDPPTKRLTVIELCAARGWSLARTGQIFLLTPLTITSWMGRLDPVNSSGCIRPTPADEKAGLWSSGL